MIRLNKIMTALMTGLVLAIFILSILLGVLGVAFAIVDLWS
jgi:hypothetical protein